MTYDNLVNITSIVLLCAAVVDIIPVFARQLMMLQQNSYRTERYYRWFKASGESTNYNTLAALIALLFLLVHHISYPITSVIASCIFIIQAINLFRKKYKKPLVMTARAKRIYLVMCALSYAIALPWVFLTGSLVTTTILLAGCIALSPIVLLLAHWALLPFQRMINRRYYNDARQRLESMPDLKIIGVTGSYGKTSTKHYLQRILSEHFDVLMTPGSFNTTLGVIRTVREYLKPYNEVFIVEMGAKQTGDIKEICDLVRPTIGIVTAVGEQHLESFKSIENVQRTKFELIDALPADGLAVVNNDFEYVANRKVDNVRCLRYGITNRSDADYTANDISYSPRGTTFTISGPDGDLTLTTRLVGECNVSNLIAAVAVARWLGVPDEKIRYAVSQIEQVEHRLSIKRTPGGMTIIDDAFNSNPSGSRMALDVLGAMTGGKRIVITPGMIELGNRQAPLNAELGDHIARNADVAIIVGHYNREAILEGLKRSGMSSDSVHVVDTFNEAQALLTSMASAGDTVLYENDLPDTFK